MDTNKPQLIDKRIDILAARSIVGDDCDIYELAYSATGRITIIGKLSDGLFFAGYLFDYPEYILSRRLTWLVQEFDAMLRDDGELS